MQIQFYHLLSTPLEVALPKLAQTAYDRALRCLIIADDGTLPMLNDVLWSYSQSSFLPHGVVNDHASQQPILLHTELTDANNASLLMITNGMMLEDNTNIDRVFDIFNGNDTGATQAARERWSAYKQRGLAMTYIKQKDNGGWNTEMTVEAA